MARSFPTKNDLPAKTRSAMTGLLNDLLASAIDLRLQTKQAHWNVKGPNFIALHQLFDTVYTNTGLWMDDMAERAVQLGGVADGTLAGVRQRTKLKAYGLNTVSGDQHVAAIASALSTFGKMAREAIDAATKANDADTADLFTGISRGVDKDLWMVEAHLHAKR
ncbi:MAG: DNA starvation/stationary phase protection protein Dps [Planctomycetes bacterium]|nr:DNA starvation/stationary phase protection protein Dps [Planctomycetota bacterium]NUQ33746.1 DNA starvation/stationary phase protection protein Dps [Planctomycetaceae bacterium]